MRLSRRVRLLVAAAAVLMSAAFVLPLWRIALIAPQYPEGLGLLIHVNRIDGFKPGDLQSINGLNHYIGMKKIEPDAIPELRFMPVVLGVLILGGLGVAASGRRRLLVGWSASVALLLIAGMVDFWKWGYDYGHDLSPTAIIKVPGMTYQPPLLGAKKLLNFTATSWPAAGGLLLFIAALLVLAALWITFSRRRSGRAVSAAAALAVAACGAAGPHPFVLGTDACDYCRMTITDARFGGQAVTRTGKRYLFDSIDCLVSWSRTLPDGELRSIHVADMDNPGNFVLADSAGFLVDTGLHAPMSRSIVAFASPRAAAEHRAAMGGELRSWREVLAEFEDHHATHTGA